MNDEVRILLVDDEPLVLRSMEKTLLRAGFDVETADSAGAGLAAFEAARDAGEPFHLAILDLHMPDLEGQDSPDAGLELLRVLLQADTDLPIIVLTAYDEVGRAKEAIRLGARAYLVKGREAELLELVNEVINP
ncbi:MAG TPA: response regulator [Chloroflexi bacterium]|nr:response regulator [Chloroflexota bacterium]